MTKSILITTLAAATVAFGLTACDQQQASENSSTPMQQQSAVPPAGDSGAGTTTAPQNKPSPAQTPTMEQPSGTAQPSQ